MKNKSGMNMKLGRNVIIAVLLAHGWFATHVLAAENNLLPSVGVVSFSLGETSHQQGAAVHVGDTLSTGEGAQLHIHFSDNAQMVLRANTELTINDYTYEPENPTKNRVRYQLHYGEVRSITGAAGQQNKAGFRLNTPLAAIGVRGTDFIVQSSLDAMRVAVVSGGISVAPYGEHCVVNDYGPCNVTNKIEASVNSGVTAVEAVRNHAGVQISPINWLPDIAKSMKKTPESSELTDNQAKGTTQQAVVDKQVENNLGVAVVKTNPVHWGRWDGLLTTDKASVLATTLMANGYQQVAANDTLGLFMLPQAQGQSALPISGSMVLHPQQAQVYYRQGDQLTSGVFDSGVLGVNFTDKTFATHLYVKASPESLISIIRAQGNLYENGSFISKNDVSNAQVTGMLTNQGAGMLFEQARGKDALVGGVWWQK